MDKPSWGGNSVQIILLPFWKVFYSKRKEFAPLGSQFFSYRVDPISERIDMQADDQEIINYVFFVEMAENLLNYLIPRAQLFKANDVVS